MFFRALKPIRAMLLCMAVVLAWPLSEAAAQQSVGIFQKVGPNPFYNSMHAVVQDYLMDKQVDVRVTNVIGKVVYTYTGRADALDGDIAMNSSQWQRGNYFLLIKLSTGQSEVVKIVKQ